MFTLAIETQVGEKREGPSSSVTVEQVMLCYMSHVLKVGNQG